MAKYRQLYTEFWSDSFVLDLTPEEKYFYLYLISNSKTAQCGIYEISKITIETDTGYNRETVKKLIQRFCDYKKILYCDETKELMVINWIKYNVPNNLNSIKCVNKELNRVKHKEFLKILFDKCKAGGLDVEKIFGNLIVEVSPNKGSHDNDSTDENAYVSSSYENVDKLPVNLTLEGNSKNAFIKIQNIEPEVINYSEGKEEEQNLSEFPINEPLSRVLQGAWEGVPSNRIRSNKEEAAITKEEAIKYKNTYEADSEGLKNIIKIFEENVHAITPLEYEKIISFTKHVTAEVIIMAIDEVVIYNAKTMKYITQILNSWITNGLKTPDEVAAYQKQWANKKSSFQTHNVKNSTFCDYEQRTYDFDALEKQLLGHLNIKDLD